MVLFYSPIKVAPSLSLSKIEAHLNGIAIQEWRMDPPFLLTSSGEIPPPYHPRTLTEHLLGSRTADFD